MREYGRRCAAGRDELLECLREAIEELDRNGRDETGDPEYHNAVWDDVIARATGEQA